MGGGPGQEEVVIKFFSFGNVDGGVSGCVDGGGLKLIIIKLSSHQCIG